MQKKQNQRLPPPFLSINYVIQPLSEKNGPMRIIPDHFDWRGHEEEPERRWSPPICSLSRL